MFHKNMTDIKRESGKGKRGGGVRSLPSSSNRFFSSSAGKSDCEASNTCKDTPHVDK